MAELEDVVITDELARRPARPPDFAAENRAMASLARAMADAPETILQRLVEAARELTGADVVGISLVEEHGGRAWFRWHAVAGRPPKNLPPATPREESVCRVAIERGAAQLLSRPGRYFAYVGAMEPPIEEGLLVPFYLNGEAVGAIWLIAHGAGGRFDAEDARVVRDLGEFCAAALRVVHAVHATETELLLANRVIDEQRAARERLEGVTRAAAADRVRMARLLDSVSASIRDFVYVLGREGSVRYANRAMLEDWGLALEDAVGKRLDELYPAEVAARLEVQVRQVGATGRGVTDEIECPEASGAGSRYYEYAFAPVFGADGGVEAVAGSARDVTERRRAQEALRLSEERHRMAADLVGLTNYAWDVATGEIACDARLRRMWGLGPGAHMRIGEVLEAIHPADRPALEASIAHAQDPSGDGLCMAEYRVMGIEDGLERWVSTRSRTFFGEGRPVRVVGAAMEVTDRKRAERVLYESREREKAARVLAERATVMKDEFVAVVSHELRTPLSAILLWAKMLQGGGVAGEDQARALETIERSAEAQRQLVDDLLDMSQMLAGRIRLNVHEAELAPVVRAAVEVVRPTAEAKRIVIEQSVERVPRARIDPARLQQVVWNLLSNAVKFTPEGGRVSVRLRQVDGAAELEVTDNGSGIGAGFLPHVFDRFRQEDASLTRSQGGLGLGLAITRQLVELHGGTIGAESDGEGRGATFRVRLPLPEGARGGSAGEDGNGSSRAVRGPDPFVPSPVLRGVRALVVEDEDHTRTVIRWLLEQCGADVTAVGTAADALAALRARRQGQRFDVLVSDIGLPSEDGYELLRRARALEREAHETIPMPAIAITAYAGEEDRNKAEVEGFQRHVTKPVEPGQLVAVVASVTGRG